MRVYLPKPGELVEVKASGDWVQREFIAKTTKDEYLCWYADKTGASAWPHSRAIIKEPVIQRRWRWLKDSDEFTTPTDGYYPETHWVAKGRYKHPTDFIDVEIKG